MSRASTRAVVGALAALLGAAGCLEAPDEAGLLEDQLGPVGLDIRQAPLIDDAGLPNVDLDLFSKDIAYLRGYASGEPVWYWNVDGANATFIAPLYILKNERGETLGAPIIDVVPGDPGYSPWWRIHEVRTTDAYADETIWSRAAIDAAVEAGLVLEPQATTRVVNCPIVVEGTTVDVGTEVPAAASPVWYRQHRAYWIRFEAEIQIETGLRDMRVEPVYVLQRINEPLPLYEFFTGVDIDGDANPNNSNNVFAAARDEPNYTPQWEGLRIWVDPDYPSIDTSTTPGVDLSQIRSEADLIAPAGMPLPEYVRSEPQPLGLLINCPIQASGVKGGL